MKYIVKNQEETKAIAENIAKSTEIGNIITLTGDLGAGKTFFVDMFINYILRSQDRKTENITSPTFNIVKIYETDNFDIYHFDLYRLRSEDEMYELDTDNAFNNVSLIEWPEIAENILPQNRIDIFIKTKGEYREIEINDKRK